MTPRYIVAGAALALVLAAIVAGLVVIGSPSDERARRLDEQRVRALQSLTRSVDEYWRVRGRLPASLPELMQEPRFSAETRDPVTAQAYGYRALSPRTYQLCADFDRQSEEELDSPFWKHGSARHCFDVEVGTPAR
jgi:hypothetical protein